MKTTDLPKLWKINNKGANPCGSRLSWCHAQVKPDSHSGVWLLGKYYTVELENQDYFQKPLLLKCTRLCLYRHTVYLHTSLSFTRVVVAPYTATRFLFLRSPSGVRTISQTVFWAGRLVTTTVVLDFDVEVNDFRPPSTPILLLHFRLHSHYFWLKPLPGSFFSPHLSIAV